MMDNQILIVLLPLVGVIIGSLITFSGILLSKRQERKSQIYKLSKETKLFYRCSTLHLIYHFDKYWVKLKSIYKMIQSSYLLVAISIM